ncbi:MULTISPECIES: PilZ domain-containing protein [unclassified Pseudomonas]|uniref:PilZ domain-containing protein n=1 Tax=unclassified Pseudomonas TaxID=196821 RepID=UPI002446DBC7|nr:MULTISPECIES: PilZ domain-containing protein [unclassified Pseudomonas]MDG9929202.1 PilZ domain-containing protein [Pseudomonas sp. GD04042]MDH0484762.1 PilZ domain-containing protein [Pseudomonas sp. GD04015]MDH0605056.1 PilZ domain-containing protein [Pseudomonas sp. GD03869]
MDDRRQHSRHTPQLNIEAVDLHSDRRLGQVVDLSEDGFMLVSEAPPEADSVWECRLVLDQPLNGISEVRLGADCLWSRSGGPGHNGWCGFHIIDLADDQAAALQLLLREMQS